MLSRSTLFWKKVPFFRLLIPLIVGILIQIRGELALSTILIFSFLSAGFTLVLSITSLSSKFKWIVIRGIFLNAVIVCLGFFISYSKSIKNNDNWIMKLYREDATIIASLDEPLVEKPKSFKVEARAIILDGDKDLHPEGKIILYFEKAGFQKNLGYGSRVIFKKKLLAIRNSGNPGAFDYKRYCESQGIFFQCFLKRKEFMVLRGTNENPIKKLLYGSREEILEILKAEITSAKEAGVAEALLIGYRNDLDKELVQAYSNTGVVHIIAISGLHLGLIYWILLLLLKPLAKRARLKTLRCVIIVIALWSFSLLSGASASVLRSALMFSVLVIGETGRMQTSMYNSLAASAFILLCFNPYFLWDVGFQLSYAAVVSILFFMKPIDNWCYFSNKLLQKFWSLNAITLSAQVLTVPLVMYHFHQFPTLFLIANLVAVPLSSCVLLGEILLCIFYFINPISNLLGWTLKILIRLMNEFIEKMNSFSFAVISGIQLSIAEAVCFYGAILSFSCWLLQKSKGCFFVSLMFCLFLLTFQTISNLEIAGNRKIIIYNIPGHNAMDFIHGNRFLFKGDPSLANDLKQQNQYLNPSRIYFQASYAVDEETLFEKSNSFLFDSTRIFLVDENFDLPPSGHKIRADLIILSQNTRWSVVDLCQHFTVSTIVADASNSLWKIRLWKRDTERLHLRFHSVPEEGAFVMDL